MRKVLLLFLLLCLGLTSLTAQTWTRLASPTSSPIIDLEFADQFHGGLITSEGATVYFTTDGGDTWTSSTPSGSLPTVSAISVPVYPYAYVLGYDAATHGPALFKTSDWGADWITQNLPDTAGWSYHDIDFFDTMEGYVIGGSYATGGENFKVEHTTTGGDLGGWSNTCTALGTVGGLSAIELDGAETGIIAGWVREGYSKPALLQPSGGLWGSPYIFDRYIPITDADAKMVGEEEMLWVAGTDWGFFSPADGGWSANGQDYPFNACALAANHDRWIVGNRGSIWHWAPGDADWMSVPMTLTAANLTKVKFVDESHGWAVGDSGVILRFGSPVVFVPEAIYPGCGDDIFDNPVVLYWTNSDSDPGYRVQVALDTAFIDNWQDTLVVPNVDTLWGITPEHYFWRVRVEDLDHHFGLWSPPCYFAYTHTGGEVGTLWPTCGDTLASHTVSFLWTAAGWDLWDLTIECPELGSVDSFNYYTDTTFTFTIPSGATWLRWQVRGRMSTGETSPWTRCMDYLRESALGTPRVLSGYCGESHPSGPTTYDWSSVPGATGYEFQVDSTSTFLNPIMDEPFWADTEAVWAPAGYIGWSCFRVRALDPPHDLTGSWSDNCCFNIYSTDHPAPRAVAPACGSWVGASGFNLVWTSSGTPYYLLQLASDSLFLTNFFSDTLYSADTQYVDALIEPHVFWRVAGVSDGVLTPFSHTCEYFMPNQPSSVRPVCGDTLGVGETVSLYWSGAGVPCRYHLQIADNPGYDRPYYDLDTFSTAGVTLTRPPAGRWFWRVQAYSGAYNTGWSANCNFIVPEVIIPPLNPPALHSPCRDTLRVNPVDLFVMVPDTQALQAEIQVAGDSSFTPPLVRDTTITVALDRSVHAYLSLPDGHYFWRAKARAITNSSDWSAFCRFEVRLPAGTPIPVSPECNTRGEVPPGAVAWSSVAGAMRYEVQLSDSSNFAVYFFRDSTSASSETTLAIPTHVGMWYWRVRAHFATGPGPWSSACRFELFVPPLNQPYLISPYCGGTSTDSLVMFYWSYASSGTWYDLEVAQDELFSPLIFHSESLTTTWCQSTPLPTGVTLFWRVRAHDWTGGVTLWSDCTFFHQSFSPCPPPVPILPSCGDTLRGDSLHFAWHGVPGTEMYLFEFSSSTINGDSIFDPIFFRQFVTDTTVSYLSPEGPALWYWRVQTYCQRQDTSSWTPWCPFLFQPDSTPPVPEPRGPYCGYFDAESLVTFIWNSSARALNYDVIAYPDTFYETPLFRASTPDTFFTTALPRTGVVFWRVRANRNTIIGEWSPFCMFDRVQQDIPRPVLDGALCGTTLSDSLIHLQWNYTGPEGLFQVELALDSLFGGTFNQFFTGIRPTNYDLEGLTDGTYFWRVRISHYQRVGEWSDYCSFTVTGHGLGRAVLSQPTCGVSVFGPPLVFGWQSVAGADSYLVQVSRTVFFTSARSLPAVAMPTSIYPSPESLAAGTWYWRVKTFGLRTSNFSRLCDFEWVPTGNPLRPIPHQPFCGSTVSNLNVHFAWIPVPGTAFYLWRMDGGGTSRTRNVTDPLLDYTIALPGLYVWQVKAVDAAGAMGEYSDPCTLRVVSSDHTLPRTRIVYPEDQMTYTEDPGRVIWRAIPGVVSYHVELDDTDRFTTPLVGMGNVADTFWVIPPGLLASDRSYFLRALGTAFLPDSTRLTSSYSPTVSFRMSAVSLPPIVLVSDIDTFHALPACLRWTNMGHGARYSIRMGNSSGFEHVYNAFRDLPEANFCLPETLRWYVPVDTPVYWDIHYQLPSLIDRSGFSNTGRFVLSPIEFREIPPGLRSYLCSVTDTVPEGTSPGKTVYWTRDPNADSYRIQASYVSEVVFPYTFLDSTVTDTSFTFRAWDFINPTPTIYWHVQSQHGRIFYGGRFIHFPPSEWSATCSVTRKYKLNLRGFWPACGDSQLTTDWSTGYRLHISELTPEVVPGRFMEVKTLSDDGGGPLDSIVTDYDYYRAYPAMPNGWHKWKFRVRTLSMSADRRTSPSDAVVCSLFYAPMPPVGWFGAANGDSTVDVTWAYAARSQTGFKIYRSSNEAFGYSFVGTATAAQYQYHDRTARAHQTYLYKVNAFSSRHGQESEWWPNPSAVRSTFLPLRDGEEFCNCGGIVWAANDTFRDFPTWDIFVRAFGHGNCLRADGTNRTGARDYWSANQGVWGGSCTGFSSIAQHFANQWSSGVEIWGAFTFDISLPRWSGGSPTGFLHRFVPVSTMTNEATLSFHSVQASYHRLDYRDYSGISAVWTKLNSSPSIFADSAWVFRFSWRDTDLVARTYKYPGHQIVPYKVGVVGGKNRIYVYDENTPLDDTLYIEWDPTNHSTRDSVHVAGYPVPIVSLQIVPTATFRVVPSLPFAVTARRFERPMGPTDYLDFGDSLELSIRGSVEPVITNFHGDSLGYFGGDWRDQMDEGRMNFPLTLSPKYWQPDYYILTPDSFRIALHNSATVESTYSITISRPGGMLILDSMRIGPGQTDYLYLSPTGELIRYQVQQSRAYHLVAYHTNADWYETSFDLYTHAGAGDSVEFSLHGPLGDSLRFTNWGAPTTYSAFLTRAATDVEVVALRRTMLIGTRHTHWITPGSWLTLDSSCVTVAADTNGDLVIDTAYCTTGITDQRILYPGHLEIFGTRPNPASMTMSIEFFNPRPQVVEIELFDVTGKDVGTINSMGTPAGKQIFFWALPNEERVPSGVYFVQVTAGGETQMVRVVVDR